MEIWYSLTWSLESKKGTGVITKITKGANSQYGNLPADFTYLFAAFYP